MKAKAARAQAMLFDVLGGRDRFADVDVRLLRFDTADAPTNEQATAHLRVTVKDPDLAKVRRGFSKAVMELALAGYAGFHTTTPPTSESAYGIYRPAAVPRAMVEHVVVLPDGQRCVVPDPPAAAATRAVDRVAAAHACPGPGRPGQARSAESGAPAPVTRAATPTSGYGHATTSATRGCANTSPRARLREWLGPEVTNLKIDRFDLPHLRANSIVVHGLLGDGVASCTRPAGQRTGGVPAQPGRRDSRGAARRITRPETAPAETQRPSARG